MTQQFQRRFKRVLIANRGEIALRILRTLRELSIESVAVYHALDASSPVVVMADHAAELRGDTPTAAYLDIAQIVDLCLRLEVDAVHPGYGFLSENPAFVAALNKASITFIGPTSTVMELMGDKIASRNFVEALDLPVPPSVSIDIDDPGFADAVAAIGYPVVVKASAGGGGKGMSMVRTASELTSTLRLAASEAESYFGDRRVYVERYFENTRHIEVQILGDGERAIHLGERECSIQRRFQKIIEEAPSPALNAKQRQSICDTAVRIAEAAKYTSAGTVEFLYTETGEHYFLEMNTRIQVEHPVTEMVYSVDLIEQQILLAEGQKLALQQTDIVAKGHAIECRLCAEDAANQFLPETGKVLYLAAPANARFDSSLYAGQNITAAFDPMLGKIIVHGDDRQAAIDNAIAALKSLVLLGIKTNREFLLNVLAHDAFAAGETTTAFIASHETALLADAGPGIDVLMAAAYFSDNETKALHAATPDIYLAIGDWRN